MNNANETLPAMINLFVNTLKQAVSFYLQLSNLKNQFIGSALGINPIIVSISSYILALIGIVVFLFKFKH